VKQLYISLIILGLASCLIASATMADDALPPTWRGAAGSTYQNWRFDTSAATAAPEVMNNPYGSPSAHVAVGQFGSGWKYQLVGLGTKTGYWDLGSNGAITLTVPNLAATNRCKYVWLQVTCFIDISQPADVSVSGATKLQEQQTTVETVSTGGSWVVRQSLWRLPQSPASDTSVITSNISWGSVVDQVVVDTACVPTFTTLKDATALADETLVEIAGPVVTRRFESYFYMEDANRTVGMRVNCPASQLPGEGTAAFVLGTIRTVNGERVIDQATVAPGPTAAIPNPFGMNCEAVSTGLVPRGLLVRLSGQAVVPGTLPNTFLLNDGSPDPVVVELHGAAPPTDGASVSVTGVLCVDSSGTVMRINAGSVITTWQ
jgi:hypothetical protein